MRLLKGLLSSFRDRRLDERPDNYHRLELNAESAIQAHLQENSTLVERATRLKARSERLEESGTPSQSARIRAERARRAVQSSLSSLREAFIASVSETGAGGHAFDRSLARLYPEFAPARP